MKAVVFHAHGEVDKLSCESIPDPAMGADEVLIQVEATSLNGFDPMILRGTTKLKTPFPMIPGGDFAGTIVAVGAAVDQAQWKPGDRVCPHPFIENRGMMGETLTGACCELVAMPVSNLLRMPDALSFSHAAALPIAYGTALRMIHTRGQVKAGEKVLILGATGGVGTCCVQLAASAGAEVIACGSSDWKLARLKAIGATHVVDTSKESFTDFVYKMFGRPRYKGGGGVDVVINYIGGDTWVPSLKVLTRHGRLLTCGATAGYAPPEDIRYIWSFEHHILGSNGWTYEDQTTLMNMVVEGKVEPVIDSIRPLCETAQAMQDLIDRKFFGKIIITPRR
jgi:alcohol dehydrogenase